MYEIYDDTRKLEDLTFYVYLLLVTFEKAVQCKKWLHWTNEEIKTLKKNETLELATLPKVHKAIRVK